MVTVEKHGPLRVIVNPRTGEETREIPVTFVEYGRGGLNSGLNKSQEVLSAFAGANVGLNQARVHTFPIKEEEIHKFELGTVIPNLYVNRKLSSMKQMRQQDNVQARLIDGKLTYVSTSLDTAPLPDIDERVSLETSAQIDPESVRSAITGTASVRTIATEPEVAQDQRGMGRRATA